MAVNTTFSVGQVLTAAQMNNLPWGYVGLQTLTTAYVTTATHTTFQDNGMTLTFTEVSGRVYHGPSQSVPQRRLARHKNANCARQYRIGPIRFFAQRVGHWSFFSHCYHIRLHKHGIRQRDVQNANWCADCQYCSARFRQHNVSAPVFY
jgi:hypothetical protein